MPLQTITKYFYKSSGPNQNAPVKISDNSHDKLNDFGKRANKGRSSCTPAKKAKLDKERTNLQEETKTSKNQSQSIMDLSLDTSEDEAEKDKYVTRRTKYCKHCDYNDKNIKRMRYHYQYRHPYIKCNNAYIKDSSDQCFAFRCLECSAEFAGQANLRKHYNDQHPEDMDVFTLHSFQHDVAFGCLECSFSTSQMKALVKHYKSKHSQIKIQLSLMHWRHFVRTWQDKQSQLNTSEKEPAPEMTREISHESGPSPCKEGTNVCLPDVALYNCGKCNFSHKSVVVLFVHYNKLHPSEVVTIDKLKQLNQGSSYATIQKTPEMSPNTVMVRERATELKDNSDSSVETRSNSELLQRKEINPSQKPEALKTSLETRKKTPKEASSPDGRKEQPTAKHDNNTSAGKRLSITLPNEMFYCRCCCFSSPYIRNIISHHKALHAEEELPDYKNIILYSEWVQKREGRAEKSAGTIFDSTDMERFPHENEASDTSKRNAYACAENLFYCKTCNYANVAVAGVLRHTQHVHPSTDVNRDSVLKYTALVHKDIDKSKSQVKELPFTTDLPLPILNKGDEVKFFCYLCNYRHRDFDIVYKHCNKVHRAFVTSNHIYLYTSAVHKQALHQRTTASQEANLASMGEQGNSMTEVLQAKKRLQCPKCLYSTEQVSLFRRHMLDTHNCMYTDRDVSTLFLNQGTLHDSDKHSEVVYQRSKVEQSPVLSSSKQMAPASGTSDSSDTDNSSSDQRDKGLLYKCPHCPISFSSLNGCRTHFGKMHPGAEFKYVDAEQDKQMEGQMRIYMCSYCPYVNTKQHGVFVHSQIMHPDCLPGIKWYLQDVSDPLSGQGPSRRLCGFKCKTCQRVFKSMELMTRHCKTKHKETETVAKTGQGTTKALALERVKSKIAHYMTKHNPGSLSKASMLRWGISLTPKCPLCSFKCATKGGVLKHMQRCHKDEASLRTKLCLYKCVLCTAGFSTKMHLGSHYAVKHGNKAYLKYCVPLNRKAQKQPASTSSSTTAGENKTLVYKCPYCPYVNATYHGTLTHSHMAHRDARVSIDDFATEEVLMTNVIGCVESGAAHAHVKGYMCRECQQVHASLNRLQIHHEGDHGATLEVSTTETVPTETSQATRGKERLFKCSLCDYRGCTRKHLSKHYYYTHRLDALTKKMLLQKYNIRKKKPQNTSEADTEGHRPNRCKICPRVQFDTVKLLLAHYTACHGKLDFTVLSQATDGSTGVFKCCQCQKRVYGIRNLSRHLDRHRASKKSNEMMKASFAETMPTAPEVESDNICLQQVLPTFATSVELAQWCAQKETSTTARTVPTPRPGDPRQPGWRDSEDRHACKQCGQICPSLKLLRLHERAHAPVSVFRKYLTPSALKHIDRYVSYKSGTSRPFTCSICPFRTTVQDLCRSHFIKTHPYIPENMTDNEPPHSSQKISNFPELDEEPGTTKESNSECPSVQLQLVQYSSLASASSPAATSANEVEFTDNRALHCEICDFNSEYISSMRRHYMNRHGKKMLKCKDCEFFTGLRKTLEMHQKMGHYTFQSEPTHQKELSCPFCLYQSKNKNNMIDHIALHREERVVPIEVCRPKLSRYLQGVVFRCHKCTFTSGSSENLRLHMTQHDDIRPYKCRLCYFDCVRLSDLEAHLSVKHQVLRNHELVGLINLDQLEARVDTVEQEEESLTDQNNCEDAAVEESVADDENMMLQNEDSNQNQRMKSEDETEGNSASDLCEYTPPNTAVQAQAEAVQSGGTTGEQWTENMEKQDCGDGNNADNQDEDSSSPESKKRTSETPNQTLPSSVVLTPPKQKPAEEDSTSPFMQFEKLLFKAEKHERLKVEDQVEDDMLHEIVLLDEDTHSYKSHKKESQIPSPDKIFIPNGNCGTSHKKILGDNVDWKEGQGANKDDSEELRDGDREKSEPEDEPIRKESDPLDYVKQEDYNCHLKEEEEPERITHDENRCKKEEQQESDGVEEGLSPCVPEDPLIVVDEAAATAEELFTCKLCGRRFTDSSNLEHHAMRHRL